MGITHGSCSCIALPEYGRLLLNRFFDDIDLLRQRWHSENTETVAELCVIRLPPPQWGTDLYQLRLIDFFRYYSRDFSYNTGVASIRAGLLKKDFKGWQNDVCLFFLIRRREHILRRIQLSASRYNDARERNRLCIEVGNLSTI